MFKILDKIEKWDSFEYNEKKKIISDLININDDNELIIDYFEKYKVFLSKNSLKIFTKDILDLKF